ncbi:hypothetical protein LIER_09676 [Lithospermum erythrorhizon]|uniref:Uncharacterized protein n=1 Tax=Lithospermum erythrorhizon TaxID=34254 RepID=A0AAV3PLE8_LITER
MFKIGTNKLRTKSKTSTPPSANQIGNGVGFSLLLELILNHSRFCEGQIRDSTKEVEMAEKNRIIIGEKRARDWEELMCLVNFVPDETGPKNKSTAFLASFKLDLLIGWKWKKMHLTS